MGRKRHRQINIALDRAETLLRQGHRLVLQFRGFSPPRTRLQQLVDTKNRKIGHDYFITDAGPVTEKTANKLLANPLCRPADRGLFADSPQSWTFAGRRTNPLK